MSFRYTSHTNRKYTNSNVVVEDDYISTPIRCKILFSNQNCSHNLSTKQQQKRHTHTHKQNHKNKRSQIYQILLQFNTYKSKYLNLGLQKKKRQFINMWVLLTPCTDRVYASRISFCSGFSCQICCVKLQIKLQKVHWWCKGVWNCKQKVYCNEWMHHNDVLGNNNKKIRRVHRLVQRFSSWCYHCGDPQCQEHRLLHSIQHRTA